MNLRMIPSEDRIDENGLSRLFIFTPQVINLNIHLIAIPFIIQFKFSLFLRHLIINLFHSLTQGYLQLFLEKTLNQFTMQIYILNLQINNYLVILKKYMFCNFNLRLLWLY